MSNFFLVSGGQIIYFQKKLWTEYLFEKNWHRASPESNGRTLKSYENFGKVFQT